MRILDFNHFVDQVLGLLTCHVQYLSQMMAGASEFENICVEGWHLWLNVVKEKGLQEIWSVDFNWDFLKEILNVQIIFSYFLLDQIVRNIDFIELQCVICIFREPVAF